MCVSVRVYMCVCVLPVIYIAELICKFYILVRCPIFSKALGGWSYVCNCKKNDGDW